MSTSHITASYFIMSKRVTSAAVCLSSAAAHEDHPMHSKNRFVTDAAELGRNPLSKHHIQLEYKDEQADA